MNVYLAEVKRLFKSFLVWAIVTALIMGLFMAFFPSMEGSSMAELVKSKIDAIPEGMREAFNIGDMMDFSDLLQYFAYVAQYMLMAACIYAAVLGASALVKEEGEGTIEFLYAKPISRTKIVTMKLLSAFTMLYLFNIVLFIVSAGFSEAFKKEGYDYITMMVTIFKTMFGAQMAYFAAGFAVSTILPRSSQAVPAALGLFFTTYILGMFSSVVKDLSWLKYLSPYQYVVPGSILKAKGEIEMVYVVLLLIIIAAGIGFTYLYYRRKDLRS